MAGSTRSTRSTRGARPARPTHVITPSRVGVKRVSRQKRREKAPARFLLGVMVVIVASVLAFGLLQQPPAATVENGTPSIYDVREATSTNTGILRR